MSAKGQYFFWKILGMLAGIAAMVALLQVSVWAAVGVGVWSISHLCDSIGDDCWKDHIRHE